MNRCMYTLQDLNFALYCAVDVSRFSQVKILKVKRLKLVQKFHSIPFGSHFTHFTIRPFHSKPSCFRCLVHRTTVSLPGTCKMYSFVRQVLNIPFYHGDRCLDNDLQKILDSVGGGQIDTVLLDAFA